MSDPDDDFCDEHDSLDYTLEDAMMDCSQFVSDGFIYCGAVGSEQCDECPFQCDLGKPVAEEASP